MKHALILVGVVVLTACIAAGAQKEGEYLRPHYLTWLFGSPQEDPVTAPTGEFPTNPARGAQPGVPTAGGFTSVPASPK
ncbi:MAG: hypothetical protein H7Y14_11785 [Burkholderiales bacterium]|nr:hypothetical protein [Burkholderiales bacterium]